MQTAKSLSYDDGGDAVDLLRRQHREIDRLLGALVEAPAARKGGLLAEVGDLLAIHLAVEERVFYPGLTPDGDGRSFVVLTVEDHFDIKRAPTRRPRSASTRASAGASGALACAGSSTRCACSSSRSARTPSRAGSSSRTGRSRPPPRPSPLHVM